MGLHLRTTGGRVRWGVVAAGAGRPKSRVGVLAVANEAKRNALCGRGMLDLREGVEALAADGSVAAVLVCGTGGRFCAGAEMPALIEGGFQRFMKETLSTMRGAGFTTYALLEGHAIGGGAELAAACDLRLWTPDARMQFVQTRMGITTGWGGAAWLADAAGRASALDLLGTGRRVDSFDEAQRRGLSHELVALDALQSAGVAQASVEWWGGEAEGGAGAGAELSALALLTAGELQGRYGDKYAAGVRAMKSIVVADAPLKVEEAAFEALWGAEDHAEALGSWSLLAGKA